MKHKKYWGGRLRQLGDVIAGTAAAVAVVATGYAQGPTLTEMLPYVAGTLIAILALWLGISFVSKEMEGDDE
jgi:purine-cytosine permease-like protein